MFLPILCFRTRPFSSLLLQRAQFQRQNFPRYLSRKRERDIIFREKSVAPRKKKIWNTNCCLSSRFRSILAPPFPILFFVQSPIIAECPSYILIFFHAGHVYTGNSRRRWLRSSRSRGRGIDSEQTSRIRGTWERVRIQESSRICVKNNHENDYGCRMRIIFLSL